MEEYTPETILQTIQTIKDEVASHRMYLVKNEDSPLHKYYVGLDERRKKIYITATIQQDNLDQGKENFMQIFQLFKFLLFKIPSFKAPKQRHGLMVRVIV